MVAVPVIRQQLHRVLGLVSAVVLLPGCFWVTTRAQGDELKARNEALSKRVAVLETQLTDDRQEYTELIQKAERDVGELEDILQRATRASADSVADLDGFRAQMGRLEGAIAEVREQVRLLETTLMQREEAMRARLEEVASKVGLDPPLDPTKIPREPATLLDAGDRAREAGKLGEARSLYRSFIQRFPRDKRVDNVQLKVGKSFADEGRHPQALSALNVIVERYPDSDVMGEALFTMANSLYKMRSCNDSITLLRAVIKRYKNTDLRRRARSTLRTVQRAKRRGCRP
jgi:TolA-binding protein